MQMNWISQLAPWLGGGLAGAVLTAIVAFFRGRKQPVDFYYEVIPVFKGNMLGESNVRARLTFSSEDGGVGNFIPSLFIVKFEIVNKGNIDLESFNFGISSQRKNGLCIVTSERQIDTTQGKFLVFSVRPHL